MLAIAASEHPEGQGPASQLCDKGCSKSFLLDGLGLYKYRSAFWCPPLDLKRPHFGGQGLRSTEVDGREPLCFFDVFKIVFLLFVELGGHMHVSTL